MSADAIRTLLDDEVAERTTTVLTGTLTTDDGVTPVPDDVLDYVNVTLFEDESKAVINARDHQSILNANGGAVSGGAFSLRLDPDDHAIVATRSSDELHVALVEWAWTPVDGIQREGAAEIAFVVRNLSKRPTS